MRGDLSKGCGHWAEAISHYERGFAVYNDTAGGYTKHATAAEVVECYLELRRVSAAEDWIKIINDKLEWENGWESSIRRCQAIAQLRLARARHEPHAETRRLLRELDGVCQNVNSDSTLIKERARVELLDINGGDPARLTHPSREACRRYPYRDLSYHTQFNRTLLLLDYRIACLRFAADITPVDDEFGEDSPLIGKLAIADREIFDDRIHKAHTALNRARIRGRSLDAVLECDWRTKEVEKRALRISAIAAAS
jgi:hypothetical protein